MACGMPHALLYAEPVWVERPQTHPLHPSSSRGPPVKMPSCMSVLSIRQGVSIWQGQHGTERFARW